jgi:16S rRNA (uracil1498-N3)-methyltransferase
MECLIVEASNVNLADSLLTLAGEEAHHAAKVLRLRSGKEFLASDLSGICYRAEFVGSRATGKHDVEVDARILEVLPNHGEPAGEIELIIGFLSQPARWEFLLEKSVELGVTSILPIVTDRTEKRSPKLDRSERILKAALKQTKRSKLPHLGELSTLSAALSEAVKNGRTVYILHEAADPDSSLLRQLQQKNTLSLALVIGPEGGFSEEEIEEAVRLGAKVASLGTRRLRAETAAIAALAIAQSVA